MKIYDISIPIRPDMPIWPGDPSPVVRSIASISAGDIANLTQIAMSVHTGTHIDAPKHFIDSGKTVDQIPIDKLIGEVLVMVINDREKVITEKVLKSHPNRALLEKAKKVLFRTRNSSLWHAFPDAFHQDYVGIDTSGANYLNLLELDLIGVDYLSIAPYEETEAPHKILLGSETVLLEGLDLSKVPSGIYELFCLPLMIHECEGAPARVILIDKDLESEVLFN